MPESKPSASGLTRMGAHGTGIAILLIIAILINHIVFLALQQVNPHRVTHQQK